MFVLTCYISVNQVVKLYERCIIACANYPEYWIRYVLCMEASGSMDLADNALARATQVFVKVGNFILLDDLVVLLVVDLNLSFSWSYKEKVIVEHFETMGAD